jgi:hypothetical protein
MRQNYDINNKYISVIAVKLSCRLNDHNTMLAFCLDAKKRERG